MPSTFEDRIAIVTGASAGIGRATARLLSRNGARVVLNARRRERVEELARETGGVAVCGDVTDAEVRKSLIEACGGRVDILVNNAGYAEPGPVETVAEETYRRQFEVNVFAVAAMVQSVAPLMRKQRSGRIINISSVVGRFGYPLFGYYCATKHAIEGLSDAARLELAPWGVQVVIVEPGPVETEFFDVAKERAADQMKDADSPYEPFMRHADTIEREMMKRAATAEDVARTILKACTKRKPKARYAVTAMAKASILALRLLPRSWFDAVLRKQFHVPGPEDVV